MKDKMAESERGHTDLQTHTVQERAVSVWMTLQTQQLGNSFCQPVITPVIMVLLPPEVTEVMYEV